MDSTQDNGVTDANQETSNQVVQQNSFDPKKFKEEILNSVKEIMSDPRTTQSQKDKVMAEIRKDKGFKDFLGEYRKMREDGMTDKEIEMEARLREIETTRLSQVDNPGTVVNNAANDSAKLFAKALDLDLNDPEVVGAFINSDIEQSLRRLKELSDRKKTSVSPGLVAQSAGDSARQPDLLAEYQAKAKTARGNALIDLKMEYRKKGLDIY